MVDVRRPVHEGRDAVHQHAVGLFGGILLLIRGRAFGVGGRFRAYDVPSGKLYVPFVDFGVCVHEAAAADVQPHEQTEQHRAGAKRYERYLPLPFGFQRGGLHVFV